MRRLPLIPLVLALAALAAWSAAAPAPADANGCTLRFTQGTSGTAEDPILIPDRAALTTLATSSSCYATEYMFKQTADIDLTGAAWTPIATGSSFNGTYDGGGHRITGLDVSVSSGNAGLFASVISAEVRDLTISGGRVALTGGGGASGALAGFVVDSDVTRVQVEGTRVEGRPYTGGLAGNVCGGTLTHSRSSAVVTGTENVGGLVGFVQPLCLVSLGGISAAIEAPPAIVSDVSASGAVTGTRKVGGLVGLITESTLERSFATGAVTASSEDAGGLVGVALVNVAFGVPTTYDPTVLTDVYAKGAVTAPVRAGGLVGTTEEGAQVTRAYATGRVAGAAPSGGLVGGEYAYVCPTSEVSSCSLGAAATLATTAVPTSFWDSATTGQSASHGGYGTAKSTAEMQALATFTAAGWSIARGYSAGATWGICPSANGGYPFLASGYAASTQPCAGTPGKPRKVRMTAGDGTVTVAWEAPAADGGAPVASYTATAQMQKATGKAAPSCTVTAADTSCTITGLRNGRAYRVTLTAANVEGAGTPTARTVTPSRGLVVLSTRRSGLEVVTRVRVREAGRVTQVGRVRGLTGAVCTARARPAKAGTLELRCALSVRAEQALAARGLSVAVATTFRPSDGPARTAQRTVAFARTTDAAVVTG